MKIMIVFGTRPEAIKIAPVILALRRMTDFSVQVCFTGQHRDMAMPIMELFEIEPDLKLAITNRSLCDSVAEIMQQLDVLFCQEKPDLLLVQGDTNSVLAAALAAFYHRIPIGHIEAGLRTFQKFLPYPEEMNRLLTTRLADLHFAPTQQAKENLLHEGVKEENIFVTGNTVIDALHLMLKKIDCASGNGGILQRFFPFLQPSRKLLLLTGHRRENQGEGLVEICNALRRIALLRNDVQIVYPVHPSPQVRDTVLPLLQNTANIHLTAPLDYLRFIQLLHQSYCVLTDSGGVQEEAAALGKPIILLRETTERPEIAQMTRVITTGTDGSRILNAVLQLLDIPVQTEICYNPALGKGDAAEHIVHAIMERFRREDK